MQPEHEHVALAVSDALVPGKEEIPAKRVSDGVWELMVSPLYAMDVAAGDVIKITDSETGTFEMLKRGRNICVQFYLSEGAADSSEATEAACQKIAESLEPYGGSIAGWTPGLISLTLGVAHGFHAIETVLARILEAFPGAQWQYANVYDSRTGEPLGWWE